jgi:hypothetical protein
MCTEHLPARKWLKIMWHVFVTTITNSPSSFFSPVKLYCFPWRNTISKGYPPIPNRLATSIWSGTPTLPSGMGGSRARSLEEGKKYYWYYKVQPKIFTGQKFQFPLHYRYYANAVYVRVTISLSRDKELMDKRFNSPFTMSWIILLTHRETDIHYYHYLSLNLWYIIFYNYPY